MGREMGQAIGRTVNSTGRACFCSLPWSFFFLYSWRGVAAEPAALECSRETRPASPYPIITESTTTKAAATPVDPALVRTLSSFQHGEPPRQDTKGHVRTPSHRTLLLLAIIDRPATKPKEFFL